MNQKSSVGLILSIIFASVIVSGSLVYFGMQFVQGQGSASSTEITDLDKKIDEGIERFAKRQMDLQQQAAADQDKARPEMAKKIPKPDFSKDHVLGDKNAPITIIEYSDYECPFCKRFHATAGELMTAYAGKVNRVYRHFPLSFHDPLATKQALASECVAELAGNDAFWKFSDKVFITTTSNGNGLTEEKLYEYAKELGVNEAAFKTCYTSEKYKEKIQAEMAEAAAGGVSGTPGVFIYNNETNEITPGLGAATTTSYKSMIDQIMAK